MTDSNNSFCYEIKTEKDIYVVIKGNYWFDFYNYEKDHSLQDVKITLEVAVLTSKMYSILLWIGLVELML